MYFYVYILYIIFALKREINSRACKCVSMQLAPKIIRKYRIGAKSPQQSSSSHDVTFDEFVRYLVDPQNTSPLTDFHWSPQSSMCQLCRVGYDFIGHYDTLQADADFVLRHLRVRDRIRFPNGSPLTSDGQRGGLHRPSGNGNATEKQRQRRGRTVQQIRVLFDELSPDTIRSLTDFYWNDFEMFGFDPKIYTTR